MRLKTMLIAMLGVRYVVDNTPNGGIAPETTDLKVKAIPTLPPVDPLLDVNEANIGLDPEKHTAIVGHDENGDPVTVANVAAKQNEAAAQPADGAAPAGDLP